MPLLSYAAGIASLIVLFLIYGTFAQTWDITKLYKGADGKPSASKLQWLLWTVVVVFAYIAIYAARVMKGHIEPITDIPQNILLSMGFSVTTMATAKGITSAYTASGRDNRAPADAQGKPDPSNKSGIFLDEDGFPELSKIQMIAWTLIAIVTYLFSVNTTLTTYAQASDTAANKAPTTATATAPPPATLTATASQTTTISVTANPSTTISVTSNPPAAANSGSENATKPVSLPDIDGALMVLMGLGQGAYLGKKLTKSDQPRLSGLSAGSGAPGTELKITGSSFGDGRNGSLITFDGNPIQSDVLDANWQDSAVTFTIPDKPPTDKEWKADGQKVLIGLVVNGQDSANQVPFTVSPVKQQPVA